MKFISSVTIVLSLVIAVLAQKGDAPAPSGFSMGSLIPMLAVMFFVMYFFMIRPEQKKQKDKRNMLSSMQKGDKIVTIGGIYGTISNIKDDAIIIRIADNTNIKISKSAISNVITKDKAEETKK